MSSRDCCCSGINPCKVALFLIILKRTGIISPNTGTLLVYIFLLCCGQGSSQGICCCNR
ncbi:hypothetical protein [Clostridium sp. DL1XJH146]